MMLDELELKQRYNDYLREVGQEQLYQQIKAHQSNRPHLNGLRILFTPVFLTAIAFIGGLILAPYLTDVARVALAAQIAHIAPAMDQLTQPPALPREEEVLNAYENALVSVYERTVPSVVKIEVTRIDDGTSALDFGPDAPSPPSSSQSVVPNNLLRQGQGSGFVWDKAGHIVTNFHVVKSAKRIQVTFTDGTSVEAEILGTDPSTDLAVLKVDLSPSQLQPVTLADSATLKVGQLTLAIGAPYGQEFSMTGGIISAMGRTLHFCQSCYPVSEVIQTDTSINPGSSGGPLLNQRGEVIGINAMIISQSGSNTGVAFALPSNIAKQMVPILISGND
jgi:S1-C subfamily serine protease